MLEFQIKMNNIDSNNLKNWSSIQNTTRPRPEGGEDDDTKPHQHIDGLNIVDIIKVM